MARRLFFVDAVRRGHAQLRGDEARHLIRVLRVERGQQYEISDNQSRYLAEVETAHKDEVSFRVLEELAGEPERAAVQLLVSLVKFDRFEWILEKGTELGVSRFVPVEAERSEKGLAQAAVKRIERWRRILLESSQQSRRARMPELEQPVRFRDAVRFTADHRYLLDERQEAPRILNALPAVRQSTDTVAILLGPEGGWSDREHEEALSTGWTPVSLGPHIMRSETAALAAAAIISAAW
jgi:16S rRNA (uracil1498-N3)-methyltransferase